MPSSLDRRSFFVVGLLGALAFGLSIGGLSWLESQGTIRGSSPTHSRPSSDSPPTRVVALSPGIAEIVLTLGGGNQLVGITDHTQYPPGVGEGRTRVGGFLSPSVEGILALKPDLVIMRRAQKSFAHRLRELGIRVVTVADASVNDVLKSVNKVGTALGRKRRATAWTKRSKKRLRQIREAVRLSRKRTRRQRSHASAPWPPLSAKAATVAAASDFSTESDTFSKRPRVLFVVGRSDSSLRSLYAAASRTFPHSLIRHACGVNILSQARARYPVVSKESILSLQPDAIFEVVVSPSTFSPDEVRRSWEALHSVPAVKRSRVYVLTSDRWLIPGPRVVKAVERLAKLLYPDLQLR